MRSLGFRLWEPGDVAELNSGGPPMRVIETSTTTGYVVCEWGFGGERFTYEFPGATLVLVAEDARG